MSDSFADLWNSTAPSKPAHSQARTLGSVNPTLIGQQRKPQNDVFSMLAATTPSSSRSISPSYSPQPMQKASSLAGPVTNGGAKPMQKSASGGGDAFSDLLGGFSGASTNAANLTMAQRAALAEKQRQQQHTTHAASTPASASAWAGLDALGGSSTFQDSSTSSKPSIVAPDDDWGLTFDEPAKPSKTAPTSTVKVTAPADDDWGLEDFITKPAQKKAALPKPASQSQSLWDLDEFSSPTPASLRASPVPQNDRSSTPGSFDFGDREDGLLDDRSDDEDDILGELARPARSKPTPQASTSLSMFFSFSYL